MQGYTNGKTGHISIRKSHIVNFEDGEITRWTDWLAILSWFISAPVGDTTCDVRLAFYFL